MSSRGMMMVAALLWSVAFSSACAQGPQESPRQLIKDVIYNEMADHNHPDYFEYLNMKRTGQESVLQVEVETSFGRMYRVLAEGGKPLTAEQQAQESKRLKTLLTDSSQQQRLLRDYQDDEDRIVRVMRMMPEGFLYQFDGMEGGDIRLTFRPNPDFKAPTYETRIFHGMAGTLWINAREKRLSHLKGELVSRVEFGYGLLGHIDPGGTFSLERVETIPGNWKTKALDVHITGRVVLLKSIGKDQSERRSEFHQVPPDTTLAKAETILAQSASKGAAANARAEAGAPNPTRKNDSKLPVSMAVE